MTLLSKYVNGNHIVSIYSDGTKEKETIDPNADHFTYTFAENIDIKINNRCDGGCKYCHENSTKNGIVPSLKEAISSKWFQTLKAGQELAIGGGNIFESPDLVDFLKALKEKNVIANVTINQKHFLPNLSLIIDLVRGHLVNGIGVSLVDSSDVEFTNSINQLSLTPYGQNIVIHTIAGILEPKDVEFLKGKKVLILGYKDLRRGHQLLESVGSQIKDNISWLRTNLKEISKNFMLCSFDCLGIQQLSPKEQLEISDEEWNELYQGSDTDIFDNEGNITCCTFYIDLVNNQVARMSTADLDKRYPIEKDDTIEDLFKKSTYSWGNENGITW